MAFNLRNEIFEGIAAYKALAPTAQDRYADEITREKKRTNDQNEKIDQAADKKEAERRANPNAPAMQTNAPGAVTVASTATPGTAPTRGGGGGGGNLLPQQPQVNLPTPQQPFTPQPQMAGNTSVAPETIHPVAQAILNRSLNVARGGRIPHFQYGGVYRAQEKQAEDEYSKAADRLILNQLGSEGGMSPMPGTEQQPSPTDRMRSMSRMPNQPQTAIPMDQPPNPYREEVDPNNPYATVRPVEGPPAPSDTGTIAGKVRKNVGAAEDAVRSLKNVGESTPGVPVSPALNAPLPDRPRPPTPAPTPMPPALPLEQASPEPPATALNPTATPYTPEVTPNVNQMPGPASSTGGQGGGNGKREAPPAGSTAANQPTGATKPGATTGTGTAPGPGGTRVAPGSLQDQNRTKQYNPTDDAMDPTNARRVDASGQTYTQEQLDQLMGAAMQAAPVDPNGKMPPVGTGALSRPVYRQFVNAHNDGGRLNEGQAILAGMMTRYQMLLKYGRVQEAGMMAWSVMQAANVEAAAYGRMARDQLMGGDVNNSKQSIVQAVNILPDGMSHSLSADGQFLLTRDPATGKVVGRTPMGGKEIIALAMGIGDGSAMWAALQGAVASLQGMTGKPDRNAEGRGLSNEIKRNQILLQKQRLARGPGGGRGRGGAGPVSGSAGLFDSARGSNVLSSGNAARDGLVQNVFTDNSDAADSSVADSGFPPDE